MKLKAIVKVKGGGAPIENAEVIARNKAGDEIAAYTNSEGVAYLDVPGGPGGWKLDAAGLGVKIVDLPAPADCSPAVFDFDLDSAVDIDIFTAKDCGAPQRCTYPVTGTEYYLEFKPNNKIAGIEWLAGPGQQVMGYGPYQASFLNASPGAVLLNARVKGAPFANGLQPSARYSKAVNFLPGRTAPVAGITLQRSAVAPVQDQGFWSLIRHNSKQLGFDNYYRFVNQILCKKNGLSRDHFPTSAADEAKLVRERLELTASYGVGAYELLRTATELFLLLNCRVTTSRVLSASELAEELRRGNSLARQNLSAMAQQYLGQNQYIQNVIEAAFPDDDLNGGFFCDGVLTHRASEPCLIELIWSYWHEESMLVQSANAIARRFQNFSAPGRRDPLAHLEMDPLRPLNNILWGYTQEEYRRLTVPRRSLEYMHHYGLNLIGRANPGFRPADPRTKFLESFHNLLFRCSQFFKEDNDTTVIADGYPLLNALKEVHLVLAQGAHNQFGDLPWTARVEMLMQQWILARPEIRDFLQSRPMVPYTEAWMPQVDTMKTLQGWTDTTVSHFRDLGTYGEQLLLSIRWGNWIDITNEDVAKAWARYWRPEVQGYLHSYRAASGVDLTNADGVDATIPAVHLKRRLDSQAAVRR